MSELLTAGVTEVYKKMVYSHLSPDEKAGGRKVKLNNPAGLLDEAEFLFNPMVKQAMPGVADNIRLVFRGIARADEEGQIAGELFRRIDVIRFEQKQHGDNHGLQTRLGIYTEMAGILGLTVPVLPAEKRKRINRRGFLIKAGAAVLAAPVIGAGLGAATGFGVDAAKRAIKSLDTIVPDEAPDQPEVGAAVDKQNPTATPTAQPLSPTPVPVLNTVPDQVRKPVFVSATETPVASPTIVPALPAPTNAPEKEQVHFMDRVWLPGTYHEGTGIYQEAKDYKKDVLPWAGKLRDMDSLIVEPFFLTELAGMNDGQIGDLLDRVARATAIALVDHYGGNQTIIGLEPGHGGKDPGVMVKRKNGQILTEKDLAFDLSYRIAQEIFRITEDKGAKYYALILRPQESSEENLYGGRGIAPVEQIQPRKALLKKTEAALRPEESSRGKNIAHVSVHFNGFSDSSEKGTMVIYPNELGMPDQQRRTNNQKLAETVQKSIVNTVKESFYSQNVVDRGAQVDWNYQVPKTRFGWEGPFVVLGSEKINWNLLTHA